MHLLLVALLLSQPTPPRPQVADEGVVLGRPDRINFIGAGVSCVAGGNANTQVNCTISGGTVDWGNVTADIVRPGGNRLNLYGSINSGTALRLGTTEPLDFTSAGSQNTRFRFYRPVVNSAVGQTFVDIPSWSASWQWDAGGNTVAHDFTIETGGGNWRFDSSGVLSLPQSSGPLTAAQGMLWAQGSSLYFYDGATQYDLLAGGGGSGLPADPAACPANQWATDQDINGVLTCSQPGFTNLSGTSSLSQMPAAGTSAQFLRGDRTWSSTLNGTLTVSGIASSGDLNIGFGSSSLLTLGTLGVNQTIQARVPMTFAKHINFSNGPPAAPATGDLWSDGQWLWFLHGGVSGLGRATIINEWADLTNVPSTFAPVDATNLITGGVRLTGDLGGTATSPTVPGLASRSGTGACGANTWASTLNGAAAPTCTQPAFTNLSGAAALGQMPAGGASGQFLRGDRTWASDLNGPFSAWSLTLSTPLPGASGGVGVALPTCSGTDKLTANGTQVSCAADQTGGAGSANFVEVDLDFGSTETDDSATTVVTGQTWVTATSKIMCAPTMLATSTRDEGAEDAVIEGLVVAVHSRVAGTGFTVTAAATAGLGTTGVYKVHCTGG